MNDFVEQAKSNVPPLWSGLPQPQLAGRLRVQPGVFTPVHLAIHSLTPLRVLGKTEKSVWVIPVNLPNNVTTFSLNFEYAQVGVKPGVRSIAFRGLLSPNQVIDFTDVALSRTMLASNNSGGGANYVAGCMPILSFESEFQVVLTSNSNFPAGSQILLYEEPQTPILGY